MMSWKESSLFTPQLTQKIHDNADEINADKVLKYDKDRNNIEE